MRKRLSAPLGIFTAVSLIAIISALAQSREISAKGYATIYGEDKAAARDRAIEDAQRKAVEQAMGTMISSETVTQNFQLINDRILSISSGYIETYRMVSEKVRDGELEIEIAAIVGVEKLNDSLQAIKNLIRRMDRPKLVVLVAEQSIREEGQRASRDGTDSSIVRLAPHTHFKIIAASFPDKKARRFCAKLFLGKLWARITGRIGALRGTFNAHKPTAVAGVRGTVYHLQVAEDTSTDIWVYQGRVAIGPPLFVQGGPKEEIAWPGEVSETKWEEIILVRLQRLHVGPDGRPGKPRAFDPTQVKDDWTAWNRQRDRL